jgi:hypothetical protein
MTTPKDSFIGRLPLLFQTMQFPNATGIAQSGES